MKAIFLIAILFLAQQVIFAQNSLIFSGRVYDNSTKEPLPYATISIFGTGTGVISNEYGEFIYHIPENSGNGLIRISFIGYETIFVETDTVQQDIVYDFQIRPQTVEIGEIDIVAKKLISPEKIIKQAIRNIKKNYPGESFQLHGYYRDYIRDLNTNDYNNLTEAAVVIEDNGINTNDYKDTKIKIEQIRYKPGFVSKPVLNSKYDGTTKYVPSATIKGSNDLALLLFHNPIRNFKTKTFSFVDYFNTSFIKNHNFRFESNIRSDSATIYRIKFDTHKIYFQNEYSVEGNIFIRSDDFAILKFSYTLYSNNSSFSGKLFDLKLEYEQFSGKYYLNYISFNNYFEFNIDSFGMYRPKIDKLYQYREIFINRIVPKNVNPVSEKEAIRKDIMLMSNKIPIDSEFWNNYNFIINEKLIDK